MLKRDFITSAKCRLLLAYKIPRIPQHKKESPPLLIKIRSDEDKDGNSSNVSVRFRLFTFRRRDVGVAFFQHVSDRFLGGLGSFE